MINNKDQFSILPDGKSFSFWECTTIFKKTYWVDGGNPLSSDDNSGTKEKPFKTISKAAKVLKAGEKVIIESGIYKELIEPNCGGNNPEEMISYEAAEGAEVIISGAEAWKTEWVLSNGFRKAYGVNVPPKDKSAVVWEGKFERNSFIGTNPFAMTNTSNIGWNGYWVLTSLPKNAPSKEYSQRRGLLFVDGDRLKQVNDPYELWETPGSYWVDDDGLSVHFRLKDDGNPMDHVLEFTVREQGFVPVNRNTSFIRLKGLIFEKFGNGFPAPQRGAVSANCGHHWIIVECTIKQVNGVGLDLGSQSPEVHNEGVRGSHIVRRNKIIECGVSGMCGVPGEGWYMPNLLIEENKFDGNCWHDVEYNYENASIKFHWMLDCIIRKNIIKNNGYGSAIWTDFQNVNSRVCGNVIVDCKETMFGAIFAEASHKPNQIDSNFIFNVAPYTRGETENGGHGIYEHDCDNLIINDNIIIGCSGTAIHLSLGDSNRIVNGRGPLGRGNKVSGNLLHDCGRAVSMPTKDNFADNNVYGSFRRNDGILRIPKEDEKLNLEAWREFHGWDLNGKQGELDIQFDKVNLLLSVRTESGFETSFDMKEFNSLEMVIKAILGELK